MVGHIRLTQSSDVTSGLEENCKECTFSQELRIPGGTYNGGDPICLVLWPSLFSQITVVWFPPSCTSTSWFAVLPPCSYSISPLRTSLQWLQALKANGVGQNPEGTCRDFQVLLYLEQRVGSGTNY